MPLPSNLPVDAVLRMHFPYLPNKGAAAAAVTLYIIISVALTVVTVRTRLPYMMIVVLTALLELTGWATRLAMFAVPDVSRYSVHKALLIISPVLLAAVQYITLAKLLMLAPATSSSRDDRACSSSADSRSPSNAEGAADGGGEVGGGDTTITSAGSSSSSSVTSPSSGHPILAMAVLVGFTAGQVICLVLQTSGGALYSNPTASALYGRLLLLSGFGLQLVFDSAFILVAAIVQRSRYFGFRGYKPLRPVFTCMYATTLLMHWRNIFRIAEFSQGHEGDVARHEAYLFVLDFMPLYACFLLYTFMHYGFWLGPQSEVMLARQVAAPLDLTDKQQQQLPAPEADILHVHCS